MNYDEIINRQFQNLIQLIHANTWEKKTITFAGDTTGTFDNDNADSLRCNFWLVAGINLHLEL